MFEGGSVGKLDGCWLGAVLGILLGYLEGG